MSEIKSYITVSAYPLDEYTFDPLEESPDIPDDLRIEDVASEPAYYIVQFQEPLTGEQRTRLQERNQLRLNEYVPSNAFVERLSPEQLAALSQEPVFRASVVYQPAFKVSPSIGRVEFRTASRRAVDGLWLDVTLSEEADPSQMPALLREANASRIRLLDDREAGGRLRARFIVPGEESLAAIARLEEVRWIEEVPEQIEDNGTTAGTMQSGTPGTESIWDQGIHGEGQIIGVIDSAVVDVSHCWFIDGADNTIRPAHRKVVGRRNSTGSGNGSHATFVCGIVVGDDANNPGGNANRGNAWAARITYGNRSDLGSNSLLSYLSAAAADGAAVHTNSWHDDTAGSGNPATYNQNAADVDTFTWYNEDHLVLGSAGNVGEEQGPPGTAKNAICVGATRHNPNGMHFGDGNPGPTADGRRKPDLFTPGCTITSATVNSTCGTDTRGCATSWATPASAAAAALVRQYYTEGWYPTGTRQPHHSFTPSGALLKATMLNSTTYITGIADYPGNQEGWGLVRLDNVLSFPGSPRNLRVWDTRNVDGLNTGETREHHVDVATNTQALKITLVWTEPPGTAGAANPVVNNLDLVGVSPDGTQTFLGNRFVGGTSATGGTADAMNNVEMVLINNPVAGDWTIRVTGTAVNVGNPGQGYALVASADLTEPPVVTGVQDTLVVRVRFADVAFEPPLPNLQNRMERVAAYFDEVSYGQVNVVPAFRGPITLDHPRSYYDHPERNLLIELAEEVVAKLVATEPDIFDAGSGNPADDIDRLLIVTNDVSFTEDWATTGPWPYSLPSGLTRPISVSIQSYANDLARFTHGMAHQFGLVDL